MSNEYDVVILGGGTGGYVAAIKASQLGKRVAIVEKEKLGGTCLHAGCIPSKALLRSAEVYSTMKKAASFGVEASDIRFNWAAAQERKEKIVEQLHKGIEHLMKKGKIDVYYGFGRILGPSIFSPLSGTISVERSDGQESDMLISKGLIIATGSRPRVLQGIPYDKEYVITSDEALNLEKLPNSIIIVGGGVIGIEWASLFADLGVKVTVVEVGSRILPTEDEDVSKEMTRYFKKKGVKILTNVSLKTETFQINEGITINIERKEKIEELQADKMLVAIGRMPNVENFGLENTEIELERGFIKVSPFGQTKEPHMYAIGDVVGGMQLAHVASHEGIIAVSHLLGENTHPLKQEQIPRCIYSSLEVGAVGWSESEAKERGFEVKVGKFSLKAIGKALVYGENDGFVKIIANKETDDILGIHIVGPHATELIAEGALAKVLDATPWEISQVVHPHPTLSEAYLEAALTVDGQPVHS